MEAVRTDNPRFGMVWALALSAVLHALLWLLVSLLPEVFTFAPLEPVPEEPALRFTFAQPAEEDVAGGEIPTPAPEPVTPPLPEPAPAELRPSLEPPLFEPPPEFEATEKTAPAESPEPLEPESAEQSATALDDGEAVTTETLEGTGAQPRAAQTPSTARPFDLTQALSQFRPQTRSPSGAAGGAGRSDFRPDPSALPPSGMSIGNLQFQTHEYDWSDYGHQVYLAIWRAWHNRLYQTVTEFERWARDNQLFLNHRVRIQFVIEDNGNVAEIQRLSTSGCLPLDQSAVEALAEVVLPPLPDDFPKQQELVRASFTAQGPILEPVRKVQYCPAGGGECRWVASESAPGRSELYEVRSSMREGLTYLKRLGLF